MVLVQMVFPCLRNDNALFAFNKKLTSMKYDITRWRDSTEIRTKAARDTSVREGFEVLDLDNGSGWNLLIQLLQFEPEERLCAKEALFHPFCSSRSVPAYAK